MVSIHNIRSVKWSGVDLDGMDYTDDVKGFVFSTDNTLVTTQMTWQNFRIWNCGDAITIGSLITDVNLDLMCFKNFSIWICNNGIITHSPNTAATTIENGHLGIYKKGVYLHRAGFVTLRDLAFASLQDVVDGDAFIVVGNTNAVVIQQTQGEPHTGTTSKHIIFEPGWSTYQPVTLFSNVIDWGVDVTSTRKIVSIGNTYHGNFTLLAGGSDVYLESHSDWWYTGKGIVDNGTSNIVQEFFPYYEGGVGGAVLQRHWYNTGLTYQHDYDGTINSPSTVGYLFGNDVNQVDLGIPCNGYVGGNTSLISCSANISSGNETVSEVFAVRSGYDNDNVSSTSLGRDEGDSPALTPTWTFAATASHTIGVTSSHAVDCKYKIISA
jgi:hypothetical protein